MLEAEGIRKPYRKKIVLKDAGLRAMPGECIGIVGAAEKPPFSLFWQEPRRRMEAGF